MWWSQILHDHKTETTLFGKMNFLQWSTNSDDTNIFWQSLAAQLLESNVNYCHTPSTQLMLGYNLAYRQTTGRQRAMAMQWLS